jgi:hypothetical protein
MMRTLHCLLAALISTLALARGANAAEDPWQNKAEPIFKGSRAKHKGHWYAGSSATGPHSSSPSSFAMTRSRSG